MPAPTTEPPLDHINKLFGIVYITLTGEIDNIVSSASLWSWEVGSAHPVPTLPVPNSSKPADQDWFPDRVRGLEFSTFKILLMDLIMKFP
ncbi:hypothetical protein DSO57_1005064 [Entomophthora muscae]|uniref:Uncharacterized protein n=1 Tax=Entomophthora muscae TaxID=34485 RepID=A0ACC2UTA3_9FUNG|nr:hypothetical protein DSO57_1005064 [Entomophthora muscae]